MELVDQILLTFFIAIFLSFLVAKLFSITLIARDDHDDDTDKRAAEMSCADHLKHMKSVRVIDRETRILDFELQDERSAELLDDHQDAKSSRDGDILFADAAYILSEKSLPLEEQVDAVELPVENCQVVTEEIKRNQEAEVVGLSNILSEDNYREDETKIDNVELESYNIDAVNNLSEDTEVAGLIDGDDDDDWEGVERSELDNKFAAAVYFVANVEKCGTLLTSDVHMQLDRLHKIATEGLCFEPQSMPLMMSALAKWNSWQRKGNTMSPEVAMEQYVSLLSDKVPGWMDDIAVKPA